MQQSQAFSSDDATWIGSDPGGRSASRGLRAGLIVSSRYRIGSLLGHGGMGLVYEAQHLILGMPVAVKVLRPELLEEPEHVRRFEHEARCLADLQSDHVVRVLDAGRLETGLPFLVTERLRGLDLRALLLGCRRLPVALAVSYALQACAGLREAHAVGLVHRDIKPSNLFLASDAAGEARLKLLDFGIARRGAPHAGDLKEGDSLGSASYAAPEQLERPDAVDGRADIWSLGVVLFEMVTGSLPFTRDERGRRTTPTVALANRPDVHPALLAAIERCLAADPADRFASVQELAEAIASFGLERRPLGPAAARSEGHARGRPARAWAARATPLRVRVALAPRPGRRGGYPRSSALATPGDCALPST